MAGASIPPIILPYIAVPSIIAGGIKLPTFHNPLLTRMRPVKKRKFIPKSIITVSVGINPEYHPMAEKRENGTVTNERKKSSILVIYSIRAESESRESQEICLPDNNL